MKAYVQYEKNLITWYFVVAWASYVQAKDSQDVIEAESLLYQAMRVAGLEWDNNFHFPGCSQHKESKDDQSVS